MLLIIVIVGNVLTVPVVQHLHSSLFICCSFPPLKDYPPHATLRLKYVLCHLSISLQKHHTQLFFLFGCLIAQPISPVAQTGVLLL